MGSRRQRACAHRSAYPDSAPIRRSPSPDPMENSSRDRNGDSNGLESSDDTPDNFARSSTKLAGDDLGRRDVKADFKNRPT